MNCLFTEWGFGKTSTIRHGVFKSISGGLEEFRLYGHGNQKTWGVHFIITVLKTSWRRNQWERKLQVQRIGKRLLKETRPGMKRTWVHSLSDERRKVDFLVNSFGNLRRCSQQCVSLSDSTRFSWFFIPPPSTTPILKPSPL